MIVEVLPALEVLSAGQTGGQVRPLDVDRVKLLDVECQLAGEAEALVALLAGRAVLLPVELDLVLRHLDLAGERHVVVLAVQAEVPVLLVLGAVPPLVL